MQTAHRRIGVIGGGQLARMMVGPAAELALELTVLANDPQESAAQVAASVQLGSPDDPEAVRRLGNSVDVVTFDHEQVPPEALWALAETGCAIYPPPEALLYAQDKLAMRELLTELEIDSPRWWRIESSAQLADALKECGELVVKTVRGGYDGNGVRRVKTAREADDWLARDGVLLAEEIVFFDRELGAQVARTPQGEMRHYPTVETLQRSGRCYRVIAPAPGIPEGVDKRAREIAAAIAERIGVVGMLAVELFQVGEKVYVNELAMRPHNCGHWSMDGAVTGQFEQHLRAVAGLPLGATAPHSRHTVMVNLLGDTRQDLRAGAALALASVPAVKLHLYGKEVKHRRKVGHVNLSGEDVGQLIDAAHRAEKLIVREGEKK
ncbi:5-(carboxyamino)imidazole ribonucleotide synthase [Dermabacteraceae bacterium P13138]